MIPAASMRHDGESVTAKLIAKAWIAEKDVGRIDRRRLHLDTDLTDRRRSDCAFYDFDDLIAA